MRCDAMRRVPLEGFCFLAEHKAEPNGPRHVRGKETLSSSLGCARRTTAARVSVLNSEGRAAGTRGSLLARATMRWTACRRASSSGEGRNCLYLSHIEGGRSKRGKEESRGRERRTSTELETQAVCLSTSSTATSPLMEAAWASEAVDERRMSLSLNVEGKSSVGIDADGQKTKDGLTSATCASNRTWAKEGWPSCLLVGDRTLDAKEGSSKYLFWPAARLNRYRTCTGSKAGKSRHNSSAEARRCRRWQLKAEDLSEDPHRALEGNV